MNLYMNTNTHTDTQIFVFIEITNNISKPPGLGTGAKAPSLGCLLIF